MRGNTQVAAGRAQGTVAGPVELVTSNPRPLDVDWFFAIRYAPGEFTCTVQRQ